MDLKDILNALFGGGGGGGRPSTPDDVFRKYSNDSSGDNNNDVPNNPFEAFDSQIGREMDEMSSFMSQILGRFSSTKSAPIEWHIIGDHNNDNSNDNKSARDLMMKSTDQSTKSQLDTDLDQSVATNGLQVIDNERPDYEPNKSLSDAVTTRPTLPANGSFKTIYFYSSINNNGKIEEQKRTEDGFGNTETQITRRIGDKYVTEIVKRDANNQIVESNEVINNLDDNEKSRFRDQFSGRPEVNELAGDHPIDYTPPNSIWRRLFEFPFKLY